ncbi:MAG: iron-sulfur cluster insertion protein ErpA [Rhodospirillaceae bacterium]|jgi:iron-sulfur cluster insertion protein|nr:iron-sulfur cluster insertion protein ErpA [Rhodospirillaceae bacterium]MBT4491332.1 iron-sulfur cluster insertion protein ErpA [Rhodospirillaceae bacterium]MBT4691076.1 iron-sulfur cluster insertion protein ErpA [Rhodospirillaceae bacterium]MBT5191522.1 iron-sulfur cluster insertion protein ErpA [Rhodospirillaceae bacterium]MBT5898002.1 iron-sulfur cluster insertion protein ErpA [Rhodospirillaceae bacterium]
MTDVTHTDVTLTGDAAKRIAFLMQEEGEDAKLRIEVQGGGCSGFSYGFRFDTEVHADDLVIELDEAVVLIDETSLQFLGGAKIDYVEDLMAAAFKIENPNASSACGCGTSFAI